MATFYRKYFAKIFQKSPNFVTLVLTKLFSSNCIEIKTFAKKHRSLWAKLIDRSLVLAPKSRAVTWLPDLQRFFLGEFFIHYQQTLLPDSHIFGGNFIIWTYVEGFWNSNLVQEIEYWYWSELQLCFVSFLPKVFVFELVFAGSFKPEM